MLRIKILLDTYYAPYEIHTRYWTGLLLLVRCALYVVFSYDSLGHTTKSLLAIIVTFAAIIAWLSVKVYTNFYTNTVEVLLYLNLIILSAATSNDVNSPAVANSLVGMVFAIMMGIIVYQFYDLYLKKLTTWANIRAKLHMPSPETAIQQVPVSTSSVTSTVVDIREPLLSE